MGISAKSFTQGDNTLSNLAMHSTHLLMKGVKDTMDFTKDFFNPFQVFVAKDKKLIKQALKEILKQI